ncbi:lytic transglycosylase domain-containing protein [Actinophytocola gossypii]|uniref:Transglycosylase SLT domain-containing protein n=1 Tax=Actinophytocola gossypii TaxID=2812003 RepID=A0ABT2J5A9_9PSEU|nr:hypothetical protein [Actinophytocola gossypii]MCT2583049.1 hypothetical protein [Actinophytocola gossypii]
MSASKKHRSTAKEERRVRRRRRKLAAATSSVLLVAAAVTGEPIGLAAGPVQAAAAAGGGLHGMTDPDSVSATGEPGDNRIGDEVLKAAGDLERLLQLGTPDVLPVGQQGLPGIMLEAYRNAANRLAVDQPNCNLHWSLLASIGRIESNHARGGQVDAQGNTVPQILGPVLNGGGFAAIRDTDGGALDGDSRWDRAVGAMQFIPSTWQGYVSDGNDDGVSTPHNVWDATLAAGRYLCSGGMDLSDPEDRATAVFRYNHSDSYVTTVLIWAEAYRNGAPVIPSDPVLPDTQALGPAPIVGGPTPSGDKPAPHKPGKPKPTHQKPPPGGSNPPGGGGGTTTSPNPTTSTSTSTTTTTTPPPSSCEEPPPDPNDPPEPPESPEPPGEENPSTPPETTDPTDPPCDDGSSEEPTPDPTTPPGETTPPDSDSGSQDPSPDPTTTNSAVASSSTRRSTGRLPATT